MMLTFLTWNRHFTRKWQSYASFMRQTLVKWPVMLVFFTCKFVFVSFQGYICHPYLSLQYYDLLNDVNVRGFVIGATNILFRQKRHLTDVVIEVRSM